MASLKLLALDQEDLEIFSAHLQDAVLKVEDMAYLPGQRRFAVVTNRFDWESAAQDGDKPKRKRKFSRHRTALRFEHVKAAQLQNISLSNKDAVLELLAVQFEETDAPEGYVTLVFAGDGAVRLHVECIEAELKDLGLTWATKNRPEHAEDDQQATES